MDDGRPPKNAKEYGLKDVEVRSLMGIQQLYHQSLGLFLSFVAIERLAYPVTERTKYFSEGNRLFIWEHEEPKEAPKDGVSVAGTPTADAMKGKKK